MSRRTKAEQEHYDQAFRTCVQAVLQTFEGERFLSVWEGFKNNGFTGFEQPVDRLYKLLHTSRLHARKLKAITHDLQDETAKLFEALNQDDKAAAREALAHSYQIVKTVAACYIFEGFILATLMLSEDENR